MDQNARQKEFIANVLAIVGLIIVIVIALWGALHLASLSSPWISSLMPKKATSTPAAKTTKLASPTINTKLNPTPSKTIGSKATTPASSAGTASGTLPDLSVRIVGVGIIDPSTGEFVPNVPATQGLVAAVQFDIANKGKTSTGAWHFSAHLPTVSNSSYFSPTQAPLAPGAHIVNTLRFSQVTLGGGTFSVAVDPSNEVQDSNRNNNTAAAEIAGY